ncbi:alcohol dehydrogenase catalytic domain-containing protein [Aeromicrobium sp. UC242_57]|uniref:alcohol dehydrogenase catalytic domain-containing protein n=1 Tax=Aeromicrobium sp. UC242_57 TaxID=3374624 RepID=UPI00378D97C8
MRALTWQGKQKVSVETVPDPQIVEPDDIIIEVTTTGLCGSDLHLYDPLGPFLHQGDVLGHEPMGRVVECGADITDLVIGDRVVIPFQIACGRCFMCQRGLQTQCETTQVREYGMGAALFGYTDLYGAVPGRRPSSCACRTATTDRSRFRRGRATSGSCTCPTSRPPPGRASSTRACNPVRRC